MPLPPPNSSARWESYRIKTPTFQLTPVEKPDMSPFLVHMTGKNEIIQILEGKNAPGELGQGNGFLKASVPQEIANKNDYTAEVVCFTESPTFALDFFRYRSYRRWHENQSFGIGFDKANLVSKKIRPVIYADKELTKQIITSYESYQNRRKQISENKQPKTLSDKLAEVTYPLLFPLLEDEEMEGFMWEREWRATEENGFVFSHKDIRIICCPPEEEKGIRDILGNSANDIQFIHTWIEYDDVTRFLERQQQTWKNNKDSLTQVEQKDKEIEQEDKEIEQIRALIEHYEITNNSLDFYHDFILRLERNRERIEKELRDMADQIDNLNTQLAKLEEKKEAKKKILPDSSLGNTNAAS